MEYRGLKSAKVQIGWRPVQRWKSEYRVQITEYRVQSAEYRLRRGGVSECKGANRPKACGKVEK
jgi:hypothetical protein